MCNGLIKYLVLISVSSEMQVQVLHLFWSGVGASLKPKSLYFLLFSSLSCGHVATFLTRKRKREKVEAKKKSHCRPPSPDTAFGRTPLSKSSALAADYCECYSEINFFPLVSGCLIDKGELCALSADILLAAAPFHFNRDLCEAATRQMSKKMSALAPPKPVRPLKSNDPD